MSLVCCPLTKPGVTLAGVRFLHWDDGDDGHTFLSHALAISWKVAFDFFRHTVGTTHSEILSDAGHRWENLPGTSGARAEDGMVTHCVGHYDICPGVCLNLTDGSC